LASTTRHPFPSKGSSIKYGTSTLANAGTIVTGLSQVDGFVASTKDADTVVSFASQSAGTVTVSIYAAGSASAGEKQIYWQAWQFRSV